MSNLHLSFAEERDFSWSVPLTLPLDRKSAWTARRHPRSLDGNTGARQGERLLVLGRNVSLNNVSIHPKEVDYGAVLQGAAHAFYGEVRDRLFYLVEVSLPAADRDLATPALKWFMPPRGDISCPSSRWTGSYANVQHPG